MYLWHGMPLSKNVSLMIRVDIWFLRSGLLRDNQERGSKKADRKVCFPYMRFDYAASSLPITRRLPAKLIIVIWQNNSNKKDKVIVAQKACFGKGFVLA